MEKIKVLLAEDEIGLATIVKESLESRNFEVMLAQDGKEALAFYRRFPFDILVLDVMMPEMDGFSLTREIRQENKSVPIIMLTSKSQTADVVYGFKSGANDYLKKPFSIEELIVRIEALLDRPADHMENAPVSLGTYTFDFNRQILQNADEEHQLTFMEAQLLQLLLQNKNEVVSRSVILNKIWGSDTFFNGRSLDVFITKMRRKLAADPNVKIINIRGYGYKIIC